MANKNRDKRLPRNFHKTFKPERHYINAMLQFAAKGQSGEMQEIARATGIPTGKSSGKVPAILDYCRGLGLVRLVDNQKRSSIKSPELTDFGRVVLLEDPFLKCAISQWIAHFNLCGPRKGADIWYQVFFMQSQLFTGSFKRKDLEKSLQVIYGVPNGNLIGPLVGMYEDESSFKLCGVLSDSDGIIFRKIAPIVDESGRGYGAWLLQLMSDYFPNQDQISILELDKVAGWKTIPGWFGASFCDVVDLIEQKGLIEVDRHMNPWLLRAKKTISKAWQEIYADMI